MITVTNPEPEIIVSTLRNGPRGGQGVPRSQRPVWFELHQNPYENKFPFAAGWLEYHMSIFKNIVREAEASSYYTEYQKIQKTSLPVFQKKVLGRKEGNE